ncbi:MAG: hypothetical protein ACT4P7_19435 [Gemmatimonadaceae bacterium]
MRRRVVLFAGLACAAPVEREDQSRSGGLPVAQLSVPQQVAVYDAAVRAAFDVNADLVLLSAPRRLPRGAGRDGGSPLPAALGEALRAAGVTRGTCDPTRTGETRAPLCSFERSGYVIRGTEIFQATADTLRMNLFSEIFASATGGGQKPFAFEMAYKLVPSGDGKYRAVAEGRVRER